MAVNKFKLTTVDQNEKDKSKPSILDLVDDLGLKLFRFSQFVSGHDSLKVYKIDDEQSKHLNRSIRVYPELKLEFTKKDAKRVKLRVFLVLFVIFYVMKLLIASFLQYNIIDSEFWLLSYDSSQNISWIEKLAKLIGNPISGLPDLSFYIYFSMSLGYTTMLIAGPYYFDMISLQCLSISRLLDDPEREFKRVDLEIKRKVSKSLNYLNSRLKVIEYYSTNRFAPASLTLLRDIEKELKDIKDNPSSLRPQNYTVQYLKVIKKYVSRSFLLSLIYFIFWFNALLIYSYMTTTISRCDLLNISNCGILLVYQIPDIIFASEVYFLLVVLGTITLALNVGTIYSLFENQNFLIGFAREQLASCYENIKSLNEQLEIATNKEVIKSKIYKMLLRTSIKASINLDDMKRGCKNLTEYGYFAYSLFGLIVIASLLNDRMDTDGYKIFARLNITLCWMLSNAFSLLCSRLAAKYESLGAFYWSILAELASRDAKEVANREIIMRFWINQAHSMSSTLYFYSVNPYGVRFTYKETLEWNYCIFAIYNLTYMYF